MIEFTRREYDIIAKSRGIQNPQDMSTEELLNALIRYDSKRKIKSICGKLQRLGLEEIVKYKIYLKMNQIKLKSYKKNQ